jgi:DNA polymerase delta subunit 1
MVVFQVVAWDGKDDDDQYWVRMFGRSEDGKSVSVTTLWNPFFFVKLRKESSYEGVRYELEQKFHPNTITEVRGKDLWGFQNNTRWRFARLEFTTHKAMRSAAYVLEKERKFKVYEANIDPVLRFMHYTEIMSTGWVEACDLEFNPDTTCDLNFRCEDWNQLHPVSRDDNAPFRVMSLDIECYSASGNFPDCTVKEDCVFQIAMTTKELGKPSYIDTTCLRYPCTYATERELLEAFGRHVKHVDPDIITGWNIFGFDLEYLYERAVRTGAGELAWGRDETPVEKVTKNLSSNALGDNLLKMVPMKGRYVFDLFQDVKREHKLESYSLNNVSKHFLKDQKNDMPIKEMFRAFRDRDRDRLQAVADYCIKDTELPHKLMEKLYQIQNQIEMAKACWVPLSFLSERGQQIKVFSQMAYKARQLNFMIPTIKPQPGDTTKYQGATVLDAQTGAYYGPITALDFASLYPSIMCAHNLCYSTLVLNEQMGNLPNVVYETFGPHTFAQSFIKEDGSLEPVPSLLPVILTDLKKFRKKAKKDMAAAEGTPLEPIYNGKQLAYKVSMNSIYGFTGAQKGMLPQEAIASTVTFRGRQMIEETKTYVEANFPGAKVRYGDTDSVMVEFDVQGRKGQEAIDYSWQVGEQAAEQCTKLFKAPNDLELEKVYCPYFLYSKKRYAAKMFEKKGDSVVFKKIDVKGLQVVRRDSCPYVRETLKALLEMILNSDDPRPAIEFAKQAADDLKKGKVPHEKLLLSKQLGSDYKSKMPHVVVRDKIRSRAPGSEPQQGDRVSFLVTCGLKGDLLADKAEDPAYVQEKGIRVDYDYYFTNQLKRPVCDLLEPLVGQGDIFSPPQKKYKRFTMHDFFKAESGADVNV